MLSNISYLTPIEGLTIAEAVRLIFAPETSQRVLNQVAVTLYAEKRGDLGMIFELPEVLAHLEERLENDEAN